MKRDGMKGSELTLQIFYFVILPTNQQSGLMHCLPTFAQNVLDGLAHSLHPLQPDDKIVELRMKIRLQALEKKHIRINAICQSLTKDDEMK